MSGRFEDFEQPKKQSDQFDEALQRTFRRVHDVPENNDLLALGEEALARDKKELQYQKRLGNKLQGDIGEGVAISFVSEELDFLPDPRFDQPYHGLDGVFKDKQGNLVLVEAKLADRGINALNNDQMQPEWVERKAILMQTYGSRQYSEGNAEIGAEIQRIGSENVRRMVIATDPLSLNAQVFEGQGDRSWELIGTWSTFEIEQPHLR